jgi:hypothetical protein
LSGEASGLGRGTLVVRCWAPGLPEPSLSWVAVVNCATSFGLSLGGGSGSGGGFGVVFAFWSSKVSSGLERDRRSGRLGRYISHDVL